MRRRIVCFGDSNTWGYNPATEERYDEDVRWTGILAELLGDGYRVVEEGQNGRTVATDSPSDGEKNGLTYLIPCIESHKPFDLMIIMLGTNDFKKKFGYTPRDVGKEMERMLEKAYGYFRYHMAAIPQVLLVCPAHIGEGIAGTRFQESFGPEAIRNSSRLPQYYQEMAGLFGCSFLDAGETVCASSTDGIHLDAENHRKLAVRLAEKVRELLE